MDYNFLIGTGTGKKADKLSSNAVIIEKDKNEKGLLSLIKGQLITGTVVQTGEQVTLDFDGQKVTAFKGVIGNVIPGEVKTFEVVKASKDEIELKLLDGFKESNRPSFRAALVKDSNWDSIRSKKEKEAKKANKEAEYKENKNKLEEIGTKLTESDCRLLEEEGFPIESYTIKGLYSAIDRAKQSASSEIINNTSSELGNTDTQNSLGKEAITGSTIVRKLKEANLPVTEANFARVAKALGLSETVMKLDDYSMQYLISNGAQPTVENIYKACYSSTNQTREIISDKAWGELENQVNEVIRGTGFEVNPENLETARWIIENKLPLTTDTFTYKKELDAMKASTNQETFLNRMVEGMKKGLNPKDVSLTDHKELSAEQIIADINSIRPETITEAVKSQTELTIKQLLSLQAKQLPPDTGSRINSELPVENTTIRKEDSSSGSFPGHARVTSSEVHQNPTDIDDAETASVEADRNATDHDIQASENHAANQESDGYGSEEGQDRSAYEEIKARRQLEEIRLKMTLDAASQLEKKGFSIETQQLEKVVEALRDLENNYYKEMLKEADAEVTDLSVQTLKETTQSLEKLRYIPSYVLGSTLSERNTQTILGLLEEGNKLQAELAKAGAAYETLMTVPNRGYGDSIQKAFANADSLLSELNMEPTQSNQRAVRILGYNRMEISEESIQKVKAYDLQVTTLIQNLHPAVTVRMIKEGMNPLDMTMQELNETVDIMRENQGITSEEKYSTFLRKLEKTDGITEEERKAYIGIYRLLYNVEKSDGAALGAVIKAEQEVTLENLLTALQTSKKGRLDQVINDEFGVLNSISRGSESMADQLSTFTNNKEQSNKEANKDEVLKEQTEYMDRLLKQIKEEITPEKLKEAGMNAYQAQATQANAASSAEHPVSAHKGIWETMKNLSVEKIHEQLQNADADQVEGDEFTEARVQNIRELCKNSEQSLRFLNDLRVTSTPQNIMMANHVLSNGESPIKKLLKLQQEKLVEKSEKSLKELNELSDTLIDKQSMEEVFTQLEIDAKTALGQSYSEEKIDNRKLAELKSIGQQINFMRTLAEKEYYQIPIETNQGVTNMNLTILRGTQTSGKVSVTILSEQLGNIRAEFSLKDKTLKGYISSDNSSGLDQLQKNSEEIMTAAEESAVTVKQMDFVVQNRDLDIYTNQNSGENDSSVNADTEKILYRIAKAIVRTVRSAEISSSEAERAVS